ncbi:MULTISPECIES: hypothetical protein [Segatella]|uniref:TnpC n=2 Tax=Segatella TaxID=2974251 RepID=D8DTE1_9BACT|nr:MULTISPECIES: hypothetical protein [Segatella]EFI73294.1 TnpC [Segatella baroniae B14]UKK79347.1 hypothetical protein L6469_13370 [Segatella baroniae B14]GJG28335.1 hypothetical protein PRRU23_20350 [Segatella bryantii]SER09644.1 hypothetical protein SAMN05444375_12516 [Segatella baroniae B14]
MDIKLNINYSTLYSSDLDKAVSQILVERKKKKEQVEFLSPLDSKTEARLDRNLEEYIPVSMLNQWVTLPKESDIYDNDELEKLLDAIRKWADGWQHIPVPIRLKSTLTTLDLRHFVWNIAERLGSKKNYTGEVRAIFIKRMFPDVMRDIELDSIRNFKFLPDTGSIVIDVPDKGDYHFHFE